MNGSESVSKKIWNQTLNISSIPNTSGFSRNQGVLENRHRIEHTVTLTCLFSHQYLWLLNVTYDRKRSLNVKITRKLMKSLYRKLWIKPNNHGLYISEYVDPEGKTHYVGSTQFQGPYARRTFPCLDEPSYKVWFSTFCNELGLSWRLQLGVGWNWK